MKKVCTVLILMAVAHGAQAQHGFGLKGGANLANIVDIGDEGNYRLAFHASVYYRLDLYPKWGLRVESEYSVQGARGEVDISPLMIQGSSAIDFVADYHFVNTRLLFCFSPLDRFGVLLGPQLGMLTLAQLKTDLGKENLTDEFPSADFSLVIGAGYELDSRLDLSLRYNLGMTALIDESARNSVFQLSLGFHLVKPNK